MKPRWRATAREMVERDGVEAIAISFLHAYRNAAHEQRAADIIRGLYPDLPLTLSCEVAPEIREFERTSTACANAYVQPLMRRYLDRLETKLSAIGFAGRLYVMLSGGGIAAVQEAREFPIRLIESGPAAGAMAASFLARLAGLDRVVSFDMGGTTAKMCLVENGAPDHKFDFEAGRVRRFVKGSGLPLKVSVVDMIEIGAGGGSIARVEPSSGLMKVGPRSAGAKPGPICYGRGGVEPTVTDADLVLGRLNPDYFLGGEMHLDLDGVRRAFEQASRSSSKHRARWMPRSAFSASLTRRWRPRRGMHLAEKGRDPRRYTLIAFGGAGPVHAYNLARLLKMKRLVVPLGAGVASALGFLVAPPATDMVRSYVARLERLDWDHVNALFAEMTAEGSRLLSEAGADPAAIALRPTADMRHVGQGFRDSRAASLDTLGPGDLRRSARRSLPATGNVSGRGGGGCAGRGAVSWRLACVAPGQDIRIRPATAGAPRASDAHRGARDVLRRDGHAAMRRLRPLRARARHEPSTVRLSWKSGNRPAASDRPRAQRGSVSQPGDRPDLSGSDRLGQFLLLIPRERMISRHLADFCA